MTDYNEWKNIAYNILFYFANMNKEYQKLKKENKKLRGINSVQGVELDYLKSENAQLGEVIKEKHLLEKENDKLKCINKGHEEFIADVLSDFDELKNENEILKENIIKSNKTINELSDKNRKLLGKIPISEIEYEYVLDDEWLNKNKWFLRMIKGQTLLDYYNHIIKMINNEIENLHPVINRHKIIFLRWWKEQVIEDWNNSDYLKVCVNHD